VLTVSDSWLSLCCDESYTVRVTVLKVWVTLGGAYTLSTCVVDSLVALLTKCSPEHVELIVGCVCMHDHVNRRPAEAPYFPATLSS